MSEKTNNDSIDELIELEKKESFYFKGVPKDFEKDLEELDSIINELKINPTPEGYRFARWHMIKMLDVITDLEIAIIVLKNDIKSKEAELYLKHKTDNPKKTIKEIEAVINSEIQKEKNQLLEYQTSLLKIKNKYEAIDKFLKAVDTSLFYKTNADDI